MRIAVIGTGHGGCAAACVYALRGHQVSLCKLGTKFHSEHFQHVLTHQGMELRGIEETGFARMSCVTHDPAEAIAEADIVLVFYVSNFHERVAKTLVPHLKTGQTVVIGPGYAGSLIFNRLMKQMGNTNDVLFVELETLPYSSRIEAPGVVNISSKNVRHPLAALPSSRTPEAIKTLSPLFGTCVPKANVLEVALHNPNLSIHTIGTLMNVARIERDGDHFYMYKDGFSPAIWQLVHTLDAEKMAVMEKIGGTPRSYFEEFILRTFDDLSIDPMEGFMHYADEAPGGPNTIWTRYITEDVPIGLGLLSSLGKNLGIPTPLTDNLLRLASLVHNQDYFAEARTLKTFWPGKITELLQYLNTGESF
jgi:opine dehydrogenase